MVWTFLITIFLCLCCCICCLVFCVSDEEPQTGANTQENAHNDQTIVELNLHPMPYRPRVTEEDNIIVIQESVTIAEPIQNTTSFNNFDDLLPSYEEYMKLQKQ
ncbi:CLUMA_CG005371, isoform A [Clunio marinus]|uniref:CLUMA_CG005371, isoform A n=1 Tax=Clunio marinus TaxID=568069 RepID=A0A1J1HUI8_9DIPT|nr:CLUMA_CG005371, isoform A [Clunio marinus]